jgi:LysR family transcriptional activator of nhaA
MEWLNYHHLFYFWNVAREGSVAAAAKKLRLAPPTILVQVRKLEESLETQLFRKQGRNLILTAQGRLVFRHAEEIFSTGQDMVRVLKGRPTGRPLRFAVGVADALPKLATYRLLQPAYNLEEPLLLKCYEGKPTELFSRLSTHELDLVLCDAPLGPEVSIRAFNHLLGECSVSVMGTQELRSEYLQDFPQCLDQAPFLLPMENTAMRRVVNHWFYSAGIHPRIVGEFDDVALLKVFAQDGRGLVFMPSMITSDVEKQLPLKLIGTIPEIRERFYAVSLQRRIKNPAVIAITEAAKKELLSQEEAATSAAGDRKSSSS